jgi:hypothetical protein
MYIDIMVSPRQPVISPNKLFNEFESGRISRKDFHAAMAVHARELIIEMEEQRRNPMAAFTEFIRNRRTARKLARHHGEVVLREVFVVLADVPDFAPACLLWNAGHRHVPLYCFVRMRHRPLFRITAMESSLMKVNIAVEYQFGSACHPVCETFNLCRDCSGNMAVASRKALR